MLDRLNGAIAQCSDRAGIFAALHSSLRSVVAYDTVVVYLRFGDRLRAEWQDGRDCRLFASLEIPIGAGLSGWVAENGKAIVNGNPSVEPGYLDDPSKFSTLRSALAVPLLSGSCVTGVLSLYLAAYEAFSVEDLAPLTSVGVSVASALARTAHSENCVVPAARL